MNRAEPPGTAGPARAELAGEFLTGLRRTGTQRRDTRPTLAAAARAPGATVTEVFGAGPVVAGLVIGDVRDISRFPRRDCLAAHDGAAPVEVSCGGRVSCRLSLRGNRRLDHAIDMAAVTQIRYRHGQGRVCGGKKIAEAKTAKEALRALNRQVSDAIYQRLKAAARRAAGPGGHPGNGCVAGAAGVHPAGRLFGPATPGPAPTPRPRPGPSKTTPRATSPRRAGRSSRPSRERADTARSRIGVAFRSS